VIFEVIATVKPAGRASSQGPGTTPPTHVAPVLKSPFAAAKIIAISEFLSKNPLTF